MKHTRIIVTHYGGLDAVRRLGRLRGDSFLAAMGGSDCDARSTLASYGLKSNML